MTLSYVLSLFISAIVNGAWGSWNNWAACSATCGGGAQVRTRECDDPAPSGSGTQCPTDADNDGEETQTCNVVTCSSGGSLKS